ncbi:hypothetical protein BGZ61DRAFT_573535 [Ilyonectria robusta]|uniref:uncharacterized protein n=1 Tax=Ilyonectria robusta TaxID=1079257 RepID=UPI001E8E8A4F|nr:uncharacterized protein BGZ61DRAFT_573535 [Ilyonectria robusta]KAH8653895.1 hypothetical protein BGZ61DRAFT_573535 [Ilyonectria robusta]
MLRVSDAHTEELLSDAPLQSPWLVFLQPDVRYSLAFEQEDVTELSTSYGRQLADVQNVILSVNGWSEIADLEILRLLGGVNIIQILLGVNQTPTDVLQLQHRVQLQFGDDERWCFVFRFMDRLYNPCGEVAVGRIRH